MSKQNWTNIDLMDISNGMSTNAVNPGNKFAKRLLNVYNHEKPGALVLRHGYVPKYSPPSNTTIINSQIINFGVFFDRQADINGKEIICSIQKGTVRAIKDETDTPIVPNTINGFWFWIRPYWNGSQWINNWQWVNQTIITKITATDTAKSHIKIYGNLSHGITDDTLIGWTVYNQTKNQFARILTCKLEHPHTWLNITYYNNNWEVDDVLIISRFWIDIETHLAYYNGVEKEDIVFHRINNDIRIGFGGEENRKGLMIGYRKTSYQISNIDFSVLHLDLSDQQTVLEKFSELNTVILDTHIITANEDIYGIELYARPEGTLEYSRYYFRLTGVSDNFNEQLLAENSIIVGGTEKIAIYPYIRLGKDNPRITDFKLYYSTDNITFYKIREYTIKDTNYSNSLWQLDNEGRLILKESDELYVEGSAVSINNEQNSFGSWTEYNMDGTFEIDNTTAAQSGAYSFKITVNAYGDTVPESLLRGIKLPINNLQMDTDYTISCYMKVQIGDIVEDYEDTNYNVENYIFTRVTTGSPIGSGHALSSGFVRTAPPITKADLLGLPHIKITADSPKSLEFYKKGNGTIAVYKSFNGGDPEYINASETSDPYGKKYSLTINENRQNIEIYIIHLFTNFSAPSNYIWEDVYIDNITVKLYSPSQLFYAFFAGDSLNTNTPQTEILNITNEFTKFTFNVRTGNVEEPKFLIIANHPAEIQNTVFWIDEISIMKKDLVYFDTNDRVGQNTEITDEMGYTPTYNLVKGWDKVILKDGRAYYFNPFVDKRYENFVLVSPIAPPSIFMWDIASFDNFRELEKYDSNEFIGAELLPNKEILILKDASITTLSDDGRVGVIREPIYGVDCISKSSVVNINGTIFWCGKEEIYMLNYGSSSIPKPLLKNTIRDLYLSIEDKSRIFGTRNRFNTYRIRINDANQKLEYLFTENGWVEERKYHYPEIYRGGFNNKLYFLSSGVIYEEDVDYSLPIIYYGEQMQEAS